MKRKKLYVVILILITGTIIFTSCTENSINSSANLISAVNDSFIKVDTLLIPKDKFGDAVRYGRELMLNTSYYIGPNGKNGKFLGNKMNCTNCHQDAGAKLYSFSLISSHENYPMYRPREGKVLSLAERVNNCIMRPLNGKQLELDSREMIGFLSYLKWINSFAPKGVKFKGSKNLEIEFPTEPANPDLGSVVYDQNCSRCHGVNGQGIMRPDSSTYIYPPLWGDSSYQPGSSMHRIIKLAQWLKSNMPQDKATWDKPILTDKEALNVAAFVNNDLVHRRPSPKSLDYPYVEEKAIDYSIGPFIDTFSTIQHKYGPYQPIITYWQKKGLKPIY